MPLLEICRLGKRFKRTKVLEDINLSFDSGSIVALLGVNGVGKTTLFSCIAGILGWSEGEVRIDGKRLDRSDLQQRRKFAFFPSNGLYFPAVDIIHNVAIFSEIWRGLDSAPPPDVEKWLERFDLMGVTTQPMHTLSRGQIYKACLVALHAADPMIWLLDEPFAAGMDARAMESFRDLCKEAKTRGRLILYTTQFPELASRFADRVVVLGNKGILIDTPTLDREATEIEELLNEHLGVKGAHS